MQASGCFSHIALTHLSSRSLTWETFAGIGESLYRLGCISPQFRSALIRSTIGSECALSCVRWVKWLCFAEKTISAEVNS